MKNLVFETSLLTLSRKRKRRSSEIQYQTETEVEFEIGDIDNLKEVYSGELDDLGDEIAKETRFKFFLISHYAK